MTRKVELPVASGAGVARWSRRDVLSVFGSLTALSLLPSCRRPEQTIVPCVIQPEQLIPGNPLHYATAVPLFGTAVGILVESHDARPTKIEGNPKHPESLGATNSFLQAAVLDLYDPDRSQGPVEDGRVQAWQAANDVLQRLGETIRADRGRSFALVTGEHRSPTLGALIDELRQVAPEARVLRHEPFDRNHAYDGLRILFDQDLEVIYDFSNADVVLALDADPLSFECSPVRAARQWASRRCPEAGSMNRWYAVESTLSLTGAVADHRVACPSARVPAVLCAIAERLSQLGRLDIPESLVTVVRGIAATLEPQFADRRLDAIAKDLMQSHGRAVVVPGLRQPKEVHALAHYVNAALGNVGSTVRFVPRFDDYESGSAALRNLAQSLVAGDTKHVLILHANPVYDAPGSLDFALALAYAQTSIHVGTHQDETAQVAQWHLNRTHFLESWGDVVTADGVASIIQPLIAPLWAGRTDIEVLQSLLKVPLGAYDAVREHWRRRWGASDFERRWRQALHEGIVAGTSFDSPDALVDSERVAQALATMPSAHKSGYELTFVPDAHAFDGRHANNAWLHELPEPITKVTWDNPARISKSLANEHKLLDGDVVSLVAEGRHIDVPVVIVPGQADATITLTMGHGRRAGGHIAVGSGVNVNPLRRWENPHLAACDELRKTGRQVVLARTQEHFSMEGRAIALQGSLGRFAVPDEHRVAAASLLDGFARQRPPHAFGMSIDLSKCIGCHACAIACQAENNVPVVGADGVRRGRHMHWLRVNRYYSDASDAPTTIAQPVVCQQCENAPCETVCPAGATSHSPDGLNDMAYNRCVGSRYCANNCPFKVRKFNYFEYWTSVPATRRMQLNPDVTVRSRGVMEKCTFCVQRVNAVKIASRKRGSDAIADGAIATACEQACPTRAITFGDFSNRTSRIAQNLESVRSYWLLNELDLHQRVFYMARIRNPNVEFGA